MKNKNLNIILELAVALVFLCAPVRADNFSAVASRSDKTAKVSESNIMMESFGNYGGSDSNKISEERSTLKVKVSAPSGRGQFDGIDCSKIGWFSKAPSKTCPQTVTKDFVFTPENFTSMSASLKNKSEGLEKVAEPRKKRVSRLQEPGEAFGGGREKQAE